MATWRPNVCDCVLNIDSMGNITFVNKGATHAAMTDADAIQDIKNLCADAAELLVDGVIEKNLNLADLKTERIKKIKTRVAEYLDSKYNSEERDSFIIAGLLAQNAGDSAKFNAVKPVYDWIFSVYTAQKVAINLTRNAATKQEVRAVSIDYAALNASKPNIKLWDVI